MSLARVILKLPPDVLSESHKFEAARAPGTILVPEESQHGPLGATHGFLYRSD
jgi:hypothetical protein